MAPQATAPGTTVAAVPCTAAADYQVLYCCVVICCYIVWGITKTMIQIVHLCDHFSGNLEMSGQRNLQLSEECQVIG